MTAGQNSLHNDDASPSVEILVIGGGISGTLAATVLSCSGYTVGLIDRHDTYPPDFRAEHLTGRWSGNSGGWDFSMT
ncbi:MAG: FAD-dependent monooxygenase [Rhodopila sp.]